MDELKRTLFFWTPLCLVVFASASYLATTINDVSLFKPSQASTFAITTQAGEEAKAITSLFHQSPTHP